MSGLRFAPDHRCSSWGSASPLPIEDTLHLRGRLCGGGARVLHCHAEKHMRPGGLWVSVHCLSPMSVLVRMPTETAHEHARGIQLIRHERRGR